MATRFQHWFPVSQSEFGDLSVTTCNATLKAFVNAYDSSTQQAAINLGINTRNSNEVYQFCKDHASCILENSTEWAKSNLGTTNLILGLLPTILAIIAPSMTEMAVLALRRPFLAAILSVSSPGVLQARVFDYEHPGEVLNIEHPRNDVRHPLTLGPWSELAASMAGIAGIILALGSMANTLQLVVQLTDSSILSWGCTRTWPLYVWMFVPFIIHGIAAAGYRLTLQKMKSKEKDDSISGSVDAMLLSAPADGGKSESHTNVISVSSPRVSPTSKLRRRLHNEISSCTSHKHAYFEARLRSTNPLELQVAVVLNSIAGFLGFLHLIFATATFSALLFVAPLDAIGEIAMRLMASALFSRLIVVFEVAGLRGRCPDPEEKDELRK